VWLSKRWLIAAAECILSLRLCLFSWQRSPWQSKVFPTTVFQRLIWRRGKIFCFKCVFFNTEEREEEREWVSERGRSFFWLATATTAELGKTEAGADDAPFVRSSQNPPKRRTTKTTDTTSPTPSPARDGRCSFDIRVTGWVCEMIAQIVSQPIFCQKLIHKFYIVIKWPKNLG
jgi:hypothetical protein